MAFYRTYRPQRIDEIDNASVRDQLFSLLSKKRSELPHAYFFSGPKGSGKTTAARLIAKLFLCQKLDIKGPCGTCTACMSVSLGSAIDVIEIDAASNRGIDEMRSLRDGIGLSPTSGDYKVYIIDEVHMLTNEAFNALLKTLEEPPTHAVFVLATTDLQKVPDTILSRCMHIKFRKASKSQLDAVLKRIAKKEKLKFNDEIFDLIADVADGSFRDAVKLLEQVSFSKSSVTINDVRALLSVSDQSTKDIFLEAIAKKDIQKALTVIHTLTQEGSDIKQFTTEVLYALEEVLVSIASGAPIKGSWSQDAVLLAIDEFSCVFSSLRFSPIPALSLEVASVRCCMANTPIVAPSLDTTLSSAQKTQAVTLPKNESPTIRAKALKAEEVSIAPPRVGDTPLGMLTLDRLIEHWSDVIEAAKPINHSIAGVLRSSRPFAVDGNAVSIEAFYPFHQEKLSEPAVRLLLSDLMKKLFGEKVTVTILLGKK